MDGGLERSFIKGFTFLLDEEIYYTKIKLFGVWKFLNYRRALENYFELQFNDLFYVKQALFASPHSNITIFMCSSYLWDFHVFLHAQT